MEALGHFAPNGAVIVRAAGTINISLLRSENGRPDSL
jgi:hypothetical protein